MQREKRIARRIRIPARLKSKMPFKYNVDHWARGNASDEDLSKWAADPYCIEREECAAELAARSTKRDSDRIAVIAKREELQSNPFDPRTEISADAKHIAGRIVTHLWILFVLLPIVSVLLLLLVGAIR